MPPLKPITKKAKKTGKGKEKTLKPSTLAPGEMLTEAERVKVNIGGRTIFIDPTELEEAGRLFGTPCTFNASLTRLVTPLDAAGSATLTIARDGISDHENFEELFAGFPVRMDFKSLDSSDEAIHVENLTAFQQVEKNSKMFKIFSITLGRDDFPSDLLRAFGKTGSASVTMYHKPDVCDLEDQAELPLSDVEKTEAENQAAIDTLEDVN
jgi:hypothetical protein